MQVQVPVQLNHCPLIVHHRDHHLHHLHFPVFYLKVEEREEEKLGEPSGPSGPSGPNAPVNIIIKLNYAFQFSEISSPEN